MGQSCCLKSLRAVVAASAFMALAGAADGQGTVQPATDRDLLAAYCVPVLNYLDGLAHGIPQPTPEQLAADPKLAGMVSRNRQATEKLDTDRGRLVDYVALRMAVIDPTGPAIGMKHGQDDVDAIKSGSASVGCTGGTPAENLVCASAAMARSGLGGRIGRCTDLSWLPF
jgi:hypothetical protein